MCSNGMPDGIPKVLDVIFYKNCDDFFHFMIEYLTVCATLFDKIHDKSSDDGYDEHVIVSNNVKV